ncbi:MAG: ABC transporter permease [Planctomycetes bacterium]|nr:ABC transporter permease [Planctomycetota bacterium]
MNTLQLIWLELRHRSASALLTVIVVSLAVATVHFFQLTARASENETRMIQRDAGLNLLILPAGTDLNHYWAQGYSQQTMPEEFMLKLEDQQVANRLVPLLQRRIDVGMKKVMLTGIAPEVFKGGQKKKQVYGMAPESGTVFVGADVARELQLQLNQKLQLLGQELEIVVILPPAGTADDVRIYAALADVQKLLNLPGQINEIQALECHCEDPTEDPVRALTAELGPLLPGAKIVRRNDLADARRQQRLLAEGFLAIATPIVVLLCGLLVAALAALNLRERRPEIGVFHALGYPRSKIASIFIGRILLIAFFAAIVGSMLSSFFLDQVAADLFKLTSKPVVFDSTLLLQAMWLAPAFALVAAALPLAFSLSHDPAHDLQPK